MSTHRRVLIHCNTKRSISFVELFPQTNVKSTNPKLSHTKRFSSFLDSFQRNITFGFTAAAVTVAAAVKINKFCWFHFYWSHLRWNTVNINLRARVTRTTHSIDRTSEWYWRQAAVEWIIRVSGARAKYQRKVVQKNTQSQLELFERNLKWKSHHRRHFFVRVASFSEHICCCCCCLFRQQQQQYRSHKRHKQPFDFQFHISFSCSLTKLFIKMCESTRDSPWNSQLKTQIRFACGSGVLFLICATEIALPFQINVNKTDAHTW